MALEFTKTRLMSH